MEEWQRLASEQGRAEAQLDLAEQRLRLFSSAPSKAPGGQHLGDTMRQRFAVEVVFTSCLTTAEKRAFEDAYNAEVIAHIDRVFGAGAYSLAQADVQRWRTARYDEGLTAV